MQSSDILLASIAIVPFVVLMALRVNAALVFLSLCLGDVLVQFVAKDTADFYSLLHASQKLPLNLHLQTQPTPSIINLGLLILPVVLTTIFMIKTVHTRGKLFINIFPAAGVGLLGSLLVVPLLAAHTSAAIMHSSLWLQAQRAEDLIVGGSALICLFVVWMQRPKHASKEEKHKKEK